MNNNNEKKENTIKIIFMITIIIIIGSYFLTRYISKKKGIIVLNGANIVEELENKTFGQYFKIEKETYEIIGKFYTGGNYTDYGNYDLNYFLIKINREESDYYMVVRISTDVSKKNSRNIDLLNSFEQGETVDLIGMVSGFRDYSNDKKEYEAFANYIPNYSTNAIYYCMNIN